MKKNMTYPCTGYIDHWLTLGPVNETVGETPQSGETAEAFRARVLQARDHATPDFSKPPMEIDKLIFADGDHYWEVEHCEQDHLIERSSFLRVYTYQRFWAFTRFSCPGARQATLHLTSTCPASVWLNGRHVRYCEHSGQPHEQVLQTFDVVLSLKPGVNDIMVRLDQVAVGDSLLVLAARVDEVFLEKAKTLVPTITDQPARRQEWEEAFKYTYLDRGVYTREEPVRLVCRKDMPGWRTGAMRLQKPDGSIYAEAYLTYRRQETHEGPLAVQLTEGEMQAMLMPHPEFYYERRFRASRRLPFACSTNRYYEQLAGTYDDRLIAVMQEAQRSNDPVSAEIAKMALGWWEVLDKEALRKAMARIKNREADCLSDVLGLLAIRQRMARYKKFPADLLPEIDDCLLAFDYVADGLTAIDLTTGENQLLLAADQMLAGQIYSKESFPASGMTGRQLRKLGENKAMTWLRACAQTGEGLWRARLDLVIAAVAILSDLARDHEVAELATVLLDKLLFGLAITSFRGTYARARGFALASWLRSGRFAPEAPINFLVWGVGGHNVYHKGVVGLGLAGENYRAPDILQRIALDDRPEAWSRERLRVTADEDVNIATYKTPSFVLSSLQDYRPGRRGQREHVWQATMSPEAIIFTNHPTAFRDSDSRHTGWWLSNGTQPRIVQWKDALIAIYHLGDDAWLDFTHAHFPTYAFDEHVIENGWAFARKGDAYLALFAANGLEFITMGFDATRELRSQGRQNAWLCQMGNKERDGSFEDFRNAVAAKKVAVANLHVEWGTVRGEQLSFGWTGSLTVNGEEQPITGFKHIESPYALAEMPAQRMDIGYGEDIMRLHFA